MLFTAWFLMEESRDPFKDIFQRAHLLHISLEIFGKNIESD